MAFTTKDEIILLLSAKGVQLRLDDQASTTNAVNQALKWADQTIRFYTDKYYRADSLTSNEWIKGRATILATNYLSARRGNKELYGNEAARIMQELQMISEGHPIPDAVPFFTNTPSVRTQKVVATGSSRPLKVDMHNSTGGEYSDEDFGPPWSNLEGPYG